MINLAITDHVFFFSTGSPALTSRNFKEKDFEKVVDLIDAGVHITVEAQKSSGEYLRNHLSLGYQTASEEDPCCTPPSLCTTVPTLPLQVSLGRGRGWDSCTQATPLPIVVFVLLHLCIPTNTFP